MVKHRPHVFLNWSVLWGMQALWRLGLHWRDFERMVVALDGD